MAETPEQIASLLIPMIGRPMLLPNVAVAEIVSWEQPERREGAPDWLLGQVQWRGVAVPVVSLELMNAADVEDAGSGQRLAVVNGVGECQLPFYAISVQGLPRLVRVFPEELVEEEVSSVFSVLAMEARPALRDIVTRRAYVLAAAVCPGAALSWLQRLVDADGGSAILFTLSLHAKLSAPS